MFQRIHEKLGTAGFIIAIVALVAALSGGAYAASGGLTGQQKKEVKKIAQQEAKKAAEPGPAGPAGAAGSKGSTGDRGSAGAAGSQGLQGLQGQQGPQGTKGPKGENGEAGVCSVTIPECVLPPGATETGYWDMTEMGQGILAATTISFSVPLEKGSPEEQAFLFNLEETENEDFGTTGCEGTASEPTAPPGVLCVYTAIEEPAGTTTSSDVRSFQEGFMSFNSYGATGAFLSGGLVPEGEPANIWGTWAVTAPEE